MSLAKLFVEVGADVNQFERGMKQVNNSIQHTAKQASMFSNTLSTAIGVGLANAATKGISALVNLGKTALETGLNFNSLEQNSTIAFETMLRSGEKAKAFLNDLKQFAKTTPFELPGLIESSQRLLAFGFDAKQVIPIMTSIGDAVAGLGGSPEKLNRVILAFGQIKAKGKVMAGEMLQLTEAGIPAWEMLAKKIGVSIPEAMKMGERGMLDADTAISAILEGMNSKFGGLMSKQSKSWTGMLSNIKDTFTQITGRVMKPFFDLGLKGMEKLLSLFDSPVFEAFTQKLVKASASAANFLGKIGKGIISLFSGDYKNFFGGLFGSFDKLNKVISKYENKRFGWLSNFTPKEAITAIKGFVNDLKHGGKNLQYWIDHTPRLLQPLEKISISALKVWRYLAGEGIRNTLKKLSSILMGLGSVLFKLVRPFKDALGSLFEQLSTMKSFGFADIFKAVLNSVAQAFSGFLKVIKDDFWPTVKSALVWVWDSLVSFISSINWSNLWQGVVSVFTGLYDFIAAINWSAIGNTISNVISGIVTLIQSIDWVKVWSVIWESLKGIGSFLAENVLPVFTGFFNWLVSWFTDQTKRQQLLNAITVTWTFISDWASYIWANVSGYLSTFFNYLASWFTDPSKKQQLWKAISTTWEFVSNWALNLWNWVSTPLSSFFGYLLSWFTDPTKRQQLWNAVAATWNFITTWASALWNWVSPYLLSFWQSLTSWVTDPKKRELLWSGITSTWNVFTTWASSLWGWISPKLAEMYNNLIAWLNAQKPGLGTALDGWRQSFVDFAIKTKDAFNQNLPQLSKATSEASKSISSDIGNMIYAFKQLFGVSKTDAPNMVSDWAKLFTSIYVIVSRVASGVVKAVSTLVQSLAIMKAAINGMTTGNFDFGGLVNQLNILVSGMQGTIIEDIAKWIDPLYWIGLRPDQIQQSNSGGFGGYATGGITQGGLTLVGEKGPEVVALPKGSRVWDHGQSMGMLNQTEGQSITIVIRNEGTLPTDRRTIDEIAVALQRRLNLQGNRFVLA